MTQKLAVTAMGFFWAILILGAPLAAQEGGALCPEIHVQGFSATVAQVLYYENEEKQAGSASQKKHVLDLADIFCFDDLQVEFVCSLDQKFKKRGHVWSADGQICLEVGKSKTYRLFASYEPWTGPDLQLRIGRFLGSHTIWVAEQQITSVSKRKLDQDLLWGWEP